MIDVCMGVFSVAGDDHNITSSTTTTTNTTAINRGTAEHRKQIAGASSEAERQRKAHAAQGHRHGTQKFRRFGGADCFAHSHTAHFAILQFAVSLVSVSFGLNFTEHVICDRPYNAAFG